MRIIPFSKAVILLCTTLLFACNEADNLNLDNEFAKDQEGLDIVEENIFVPLDKAAEVADLFFNKLTGYNVSTRGGETSVQTLSENDNPLMYVINYSGGGFVIIGATKNYYPILAYSDKNSFKITSEMNGVSDWLEQTKEAVKTSYTFNDTIKSAMQNLWSRYETAKVLPSMAAQDAQTRSSYSSGEIACWNRCDELQMQYGGDGWTFLPLSQAQQVFDDAGFFGIYDNLCFGADFNHSPVNCSIVGYKNIYKNEQVGPLLSTQWHQGTPFNNLCNSKPAGCGAIAVAQVMKYYQYPQSFNLNGYTFNWNNIPVAPQSNSDQDALVRLAGLFVNMHYSSSGSWATPSDMKDGIRNLGYNVTRSDHNCDRVEKEILSNSRPVIMGGNDDNIPLPSPLNYLGDSHYWVCDGARRITTGQMQYFTIWQPNGNGTFTPGWYSLEFPDLLGGMVYLYFHMNWGWGGSHDGWFAFNNVNSGNGDFEHARQDFYITKP